MLFSFQHYNSYCILFTVLFLYILDVIFKDIIHLGTYFYFKPNNTVIHITTSSKFDICPSSTDSSFYIFDSLNYPLLAVKGIYCLKVNKVFKFNDGYSFSDFQ